MAATSVVVRKTVEGNFSLQPTSPGDVGFVPAVVVNGDDPDLGEVLAALFEDPAEDEADGGE